jgi:hypothetical protein
MPPFVPGSIFTRKRRVTTIIHEKRTRIKVWTLLLWYFIYKF